MTAVCGFDGDKTWKAGYQKDNQQIIFEVKNIKESVSIYKCENCVIQIKGKTTNITVSECKNTGVVFENSITGLSIVRCNKCQFQATGVCSMFTIDNSEACTMFVTREQYKSIEFVSSKSSEIHIIVPGPTEDSDPMEFTIPAQFTTKFEGNTFKTKPVEHI
ncbi:adenylyl cyclase-associated protein [Anaeramoeba ignava]|uniref:Adenylyl cyclase-associated protein n=1 Tax=Anaeramoeba ignava TaxID=1746090 RepID=A0A9Q0R4R9_ANAIG|nr:adenylyl cyclase-associated protein [Anaeramoeba ignava]|eukprot:Anaeramoba_ignava/a91533_883.p1 GENE.a91533_883~~a91533_883.p1  ORF type:complete len:162 (+),score=46.68 a91533_883:307-792(+)